MQTEQREKLQSQINAENGTESNKNYSELDKEVIELKKYKGLQITHHENKHFATIGMYRITEYYTTEEELINYINENMWELVIVIAANVSERMQGHALKDEKIHQNGL